MSRLTKKVSKIEAMLDYGSEYLPSENCHSEFELYYKLGELEDLLEKYNVNSIEKLDEILSNYGKTFWIDEEAKENER